MVLGKQLYLFFQVNGFLKSISQKSNNWEVIKIDWGGFSLPNRFFNWEILSKAR
jgi:hypothetical protein